MISVGKVLNGYPIDFEYTVEEYVSKDELRNPRCYHLHIVGLVDQENPYHHEYTIFLKQDGHSIDLENVLICEDSDTLKEVKERVFIECLKTLCIREDELNEYMARVS